jgi:hypothetical protein
MKRQLEVLDGEVDLDLTEAGSGDRR